MPRPGESSSLDSECTGRDDSHLDIRDEGSNSSNCSRDGASSSEIAGQRLYLQALETQRKIEEARKEKEDYKPTVKLATKRGDSCKDGKSETPRYIQLYEQAKNKQLITDVSPSSSQDCKELKIKTTRDVSTNEGCDRLYALSKSKQEEGRHRRNEITKLKAKAPQPSHHNMKIPADQATRMYDRGMKHLISLEMKRIEAAVKTEQPYKSPLVDIEARKTSSE